MFVDFNILNQLGSPSINSNTFANRPPAGQIGRLFVSTDTFEIYRDNGTTWDLIGGPGSSTITGTGTATQVAYFTSSQAIGSSSNLYWDNTNIRLGIGTSTPGTRLDIHGTGIMQHINATGATANSLMAFQRTGTNVWRLGDQYNGGNNFFEIHNIALANNAIQIDAATNKSIFTSIQNYVSGLARANYFDYTLNLPNGTTISSPNAVTTLGSTLNLNIAGSATLPNGARSGMDVFNGVNFTSAGTFTINQASTIRAFSNLTSGWAFNGSAVGTITHLAGMRVLFPTNSGTSINVTTNYGLLINDQTANTGTITYTNRWGIYQEGASDLNYMAANLLLGSTVNNGNKLQVTGNGNLTGDMTADAYYLNGMTAGNGALYWTSDRVTLANYNANGVLHFEVNGGTFAAMFNAAGNLGLGQAPNSTWIANSKAIQIKDWTSLSQRTDGAAVFGMNIVETSSNSYSYLQSFSAGRYQINGNEHTWYTAPSGTAGNAISFTQAMTLDASGRLAIGLTSPVARLHIENSASADPTSLSSVPTTNIFGMSTSPGGMLAAGIGATGGTYVWLQGRNVAGAGVSYPISLQPLGGNVGIGTTSPQSRLNVAGAKTNSADLTTITNQLAVTDITATAAGVGGRISFLGAYTATPDYFPFGSIEVLKDNANNYGSAGWNNAAMRFIVGNNDNDANAGRMLERMRITSGGNVGIGTTIPASFSAPANQLVVGTTSGNNGITIAAGSTAVSSLYLADGTTGNEAYRGYLEYVHSSDYMAFGTAASERMRITSGGNVLVGTTTDAGQKLQVAGTVATTSSITTGAPSGGTAAAWKFGSRIADNVALDATQYIQLDVGGTLYKLAVVTIIPPP